MSESMTEAEKRKAPEGEATPAEKKDAGTPEAKKLKTSAPDPAAVRKQVEYYLSDDNLKHDKFFSEKISSNADGWLEMSLVLSCNKMKAMRATKEDVMAALKASKLEMKEDGSAIRRPGNAPLPKLEAKPQHHQKKNSVHAHEGGAILAFKSIPAEQSWMQIKEKLAEKLPDKVAPWHVSEVNDKGQCFVVCPPFEGDLKLLEGVEIEIGGAKLKGELCFGDTLQQTLKTLPKHIRDKREKEARKKQKERNRPIVVGNQRFVNVGALRGKVKEILNSRSDGESLKPDGTDFKLIKALLEYHPKGAAKSQGMVGIKVAKHSQGESRCFYMVREDKSEEDVSMKKCIDAVELNPPYITIEKKSKEEGDKAKAPASGASASSGATAAKPEKKAEPLKPEGDAKPEAAAAGSTAPAAAAEPAEAAKP
eukprot:CAMPEP_0170240238 /NCGR_PEP_ID=MMETSP0116_2-20130129/19877_1 /TAXON_ID=400756 /ORGANISM="Durinskia baltica, Strain CSIRO CS-38" /LENGTH=422 /DNA_ID=CAMNT_0010491057 /DNA_START=44 /DNA_END=1308 /DNA_ORIENTATION=+